MACHSVIGFMMMVMVMVLFCCLASGREEDVKPPSGLIRSAAKWLHLRLFLRSNGKTDFVKINPGQARQAQRQRNLFVTTSTSTVSSTLAAVTSVLTTWSTCFVTEVPMPLCSSSTLVGVKKRKKRSEVIIKDPIQSAVAEPVLIKATRVAAAEAEVASSVDDSLGPVIMGRTQNGSPRLLFTLLTTSTSTLTTTIVATVVANGYQTLRFTSNAANPGCLPLTFLTANNVGPC